MKYFVLLCALVAGIYWVKSRKPTNFPFLAMTPAKANTEAKETCFDKPKCVLVYLAPWCPYCHNGIPVIQALQTKFKDSPDVGLIVVIGSDQLEKLETMASLIGPHTFVDPQKTVSKAIGVESLPTWVVISSKRKIVNRVSGINMNVNDQLARLEL